LQLPEKDYPSFQRRVAFVQQLEERLAAVAGIGVFAMTDGLPVSPGGQRMTLHREGSPAAAALPPAVTSIGISPRYFETLNLPLMRGRDFNDRDGRSDVASVIVNKRFADLYFPGEDPIGRSIRVSQTATNGQPLTMLVVGVSQVIRQGFDSSIEPVLYVPYRMQPSPAFSVVVRSTQSSAVLMSNIRDEVQHIDPALPVFDVLRMDQVVTRMVWLGRIFGGMFAIFASMSLVLSAVGLYGVTAYLVGQRTREIAIRVALGATRSQVWWWVLHRAIAQLAVGLALGISGVLLLAPLLQGILVGTYATDFSTITGICLMFVFVSLAASFVPARRATMLSPAAALHYE
jgi:predicted permease